MLLVTYEKGPAGTGCVPGSQKRETPMKIAVCDDCHEDAAQLETFLEGEDTRLYFDALRLLADVENRQMRFDLYLLDIFMDDSMGGIELAERIRARDEEAVICFISTSDAFYRQAYDLYAVQYLLKPVREADVRRLLERLARHRGRERDQRLGYKWRGQAGFIPYGRIHYIDSREHTLFIHCQDGTVQACKGKLDDLEIQVCGEVFFRCHQSFIVNMYHVDRLEGSELLVAGQSIPVSRRYFASVKSRYQEILFEEVD